MLIAQPFLWHYVLLIIAKILINVPWNPAVSSSALIKEYNSLVLAPELSFRMMTAFIMFRSFVRERKTV